MKSVKHYLVLGACLGVIVFVGALVKAAPDLPEKLRESASMPWWDIPLGLLGVVLFFAALLLFCAAVAGLAGWLQLHAEKRRGAGEKPVIVRR